MPGITAALGVAAYAGIPLTHRDYAQSCVFVTGHLKDGSMDLDWPALARPRQTIVVYMGLPGLPVLCAELARHGLPATTPAAIVQQGTHASQRVVTGTLRTLPRRAERAALHGPTLIIVGDVVRLRDRLNWFKPRRAGTRVIAIRPDDSSARATTCVNLSPMDGSRFATLLRSPIIPCLRPLSTIR